MASIDRDYMNRRTRKREDDPARYDPRGSQGRIEHDQAGGGRGQRSDDHGRGSVAEEQAAHSGCPQRGGMRGIRQQGDDRNLRAFG